ncbi:hypothetical protein ACFQL1_01535 [Halomicroarcula sp. GCM10025709]|uniref:hypothetical protein n=1 Tax=Haloarcula TaxID=2237 RepID=UPI0024C3A904|nr:hypothetical protein [Halomicroarcula sp. YJ-61-S]
MPRVRHTGDGGHYRVGGHGFDPGDEHNVDDDLAGYLGDHDDFEVLDEAGEGNSEDTDPDEGDSEFRFDPGDATDFSANGWLDNDYQDRADAVRAGGLDDYLAEIEDAETSETVIDAVDERRDELEG